MQSKSDNAEIMMGIETDIINEAFEFFLKKISITIKNKNESK